MTQYQQGLMAYRGVAESVGILGYYLMPVSRAPEFDRGYWDAHRADHSDEGYIKSRK